MDLLIVEPLEADLIRWLEDRHRIRYAPGLAHEPQALQDAMGEARAVIIPPSVAMGAMRLRLAPNLVAIGRVSGGAEKIDLDACTRAGVEVVRSPTATALAEAEFMLGAMLALFRRVPITGSDGMLVGRELGGSTIGLIGMAPCARSVAQLLSGFGSRVVGYDPALHASEGVWKRWRIEPISLRNLIEQSDAVCVQLPYYSRYRGLIGERILPFCKPNQVMVSISPSGLFHEPTLALALSERRMAAVWFDSLEPGMLDVGRPLHGLDNVQVTPRLASTTRESRSRSSWAVAQRIDELLQIAPPRLFQGTRPAAFRSSIPGELPDREDDPTSY